MSSKKYAISLFVLFLIMGLSTSVLGISGSDELSVDQLYKIQDEDGRHSNLLNIEFYPGYINRYSVGENFYGGDIVYVSTLSNFIQVVAREPNNILKKANSMSEVRNAEFEVSGQVLFEPNDPIYDEGASFSRPSSRGGGVWPHHAWYADAVGANTAWDLTKGYKSNVAMCIIDLGYSTGHSEFTSGNYIRGYDFEEDDTNPQLRTGYDETHHGNWVSGVSVAKINNNNKIAGIAGDARWYWVKVNSYVFWGHLKISAGAMREAIDWCADRIGTDGISKLVISISWGTTTSSTTIKNGINNAWNDGALIIAGAGNDGQSDPLYPARYDNVVAVGGVNNLLTRWDDSTGTSAKNPEVVAPASWIVTIHPGSSNGWDYVFGTSFAAPIVASIAVLGWSIDDSMNNAGVRQLLRSTTDYLGSSTYYGYGLVRADSVVLAAAGV